MNRTRTTLFSLLSLGMLVGVVSLSYADSADKAQQTANAQFVEMTFTSLCQRQPDPASFNYFWGLLNEGARTYDEVRDAVKAACRPHDTRAACDHVSGLDLCKPS